MSGRWLVFGNDKIAHYVDEQLLCNAEGTAERLWSVFQDVGRIPLCKKCMTKIRQRNRASDASPKAMKALYRQLAIDTAAELRLSERGDPFDDWRPSK